MQVFLFLRVRAGRNRGRYIAENAPKNARFGDDAQSFEHSRLLC